METETGLLDRIIDYELGVLDSMGVLRLFADMIESGIVWHLQGAYGRTAKNLITLGYISEEGEILKAEPIQP